LGRVARYREWDFEIEQLAHDLEQQRLRERKSIKLTVNLLKHIAMKIGLKELKVMTYDEIVGLRKRYGL